MNKIFATIALVTLAACTSKTPETAADTTAVVTDTTVRVDTTSAPDSTTVTADTTKAAQ